MSCERYASAIVDHAFGAELPGDAAEHLRTCAACHQVFDEQQGLARSLDEDLRLALAVEPSARFESDVLARVDRSSSAWRWVPAWNLPMAAAAGILILVALSMGRFGERRVVERSHEVQVRQASAEATPSPAPVTVPSARAEENHRPAPTKRRDSRLAARSNDGARRENAAERQRCGPTPGAAQSVPPAARRRTCGSRGVIFKPVLSLSGQAGDEAPPDDRRHSESSFTDVPPATARKEKDRRAGELLE